MNDRPRTEAARPSPSARGANSVAGPAIVVLGCRAYIAKDGVGLTGALGRRVREAANVFAASEGATVIASGGCRWADVVEADAMAKELVRLGVPEGRIVRDRCSLWTRENARYSALAMRRRGITHAVVVTCAWHLPRALALFRREGVDVVGAPVQGPRLPLLRRIYRACHERVAMRLDLAILSRVAVVLALVALGCSKPSATLPSPSDALAPAPRDFAPIARAEDQRRAKDIPEAVRASHDVETRRRAARALARIADAASLPGLLRALADDDPETAAWGAFGLGASCRAGADASDERVRTLAARAASLSAPDAGAPADPRSAIVRAIGRCAKATADDASIAESTLSAWVRSGVAAETAAYALGDIASKSKRLADASATALLDAAAGKPGTPPLDAALYPFGRAKSVSEAFASRLLETARAALARPGEARVFAVRALGRAGGDAAMDLVKIVETKTFTPAERAEAARALRGLGREGRAAAAEALVYLVPEKDPVAIGSLAGAELGVMRTLLDAVGLEPPKKADASLYALVRLAPPAGASSSLALRIAELRCGAALALARGAYDADVLRKCDAEGTEPYERARLAALLAKPHLVQERRAAWLVLARSTHIKVREAAIEGLADHAELWETARQPIAEALASGKAGLADVAADALHTHPERAFTLAASERRAALDPNAPPPTATPAQELDPLIAKALKAAVATPWAEDLVETRMAIVDAMMALGMKEGKEAALAACRDANVSVRQRAAIALQGAKEDTASCNPPDTAPAAAPEIDQPLDKPVKVAFVFDAGTFAITFDPALTPIAAARLVALAKAGFYNGIVVHRVVPGFVVQFGDPGGDGFGGSGKLLRCETAPVPFRPLDVGIALAGRDTGSSQIFVTLVRSPHLDGEFSRVGVAEGEWDAVAEGDVVREVRVDE